MTENSAVKLPPNLFRVWKRAAKRNDKSIMALARQAGKRLWQTGMALVNQINAEEITEIEKIRSRVDAAEWLKEIAVPKAKNEILESEFSELEMAFAEATRKNKSEKINPEDLASINEARKAAGLAPKLSV